MTEQDLIEACQQAKAIIAGPIPGFATQAADALIDSWFLRKIVLLALERRREGRDFGPGDVFRMPEVAAHAASAGGP